jgi:hypothetical protein
MGLILDVFFFKYISIFKKIRGKDVGFQKQLRTDQFNSILKVNKFKCIFKVVDYKCRVEYKQSTNFKCIAIGRRTKMTLTFCEFSVIFCVVDAGRIKMKHFCDVVFLIFRSGYLVKVFERRIGPVTPTNANFFVWSKHLHRPTYWFEMKFGIIIGILFKDA